MRIRSFVGVALAVALAVPGCAQKSDSDFAAVQEGQKQILAKLDELKKDIAAKPAAPAAQRPQVDPNKVYEIPIASSAVRGPKDAPVTLVMFSDFQCPYCARSAPTIEEVLKSYPKDVNFVMKQFPLPMHAQADPAARAAIAAGKQGKFWEMHDELYKTTQVPPGITPESIKGIAEKIGLDSKKFEADLNSEEVKTQVKTEIALGQASNVRGTPTFFLNGKVAQVRDVPGFKALIDAELKAKGKKTS